MPIANLPAPGGAGTRLRRLRWADFPSALLYMSPAIALFLSFTFIPFFRALQLSVSIIDRNTFKPARFVGLLYYGRVFNLGDGALGFDYLRSIATSAVFALMTVPASIALALLIGVIAKRKLPGIGAFRTVFSTSVAISMASAGVIWALIFSPNVNLTGWILKLIGSASQGILNESRTALPAVALMTVWTSLGFNFIIILAGLQSIPKELYESALIDGAGSWRVFRRITLPLLGPTLIFLGIVTTISCFQAFTQFKVMIDSAGPDKSTNVFVYSIFEAFWMENNYGFASAMSVVLFAVLLVLSLAQLSLDNKVHYQ